jgi:hydroxycarboxylate dehydrogenase B
MTTTARPDVTALPASAAAELAAAIFEAIGSPPAEATLIAQELVTANLIGIASHGLMRVPEYVKAAAEGDVKPGAEATIVAETASTAVVDCGRNFGQVGAYRALDVAIGKARETGVGCVVTRNCHHAGRLGAYPEAAARHGLLCLATAAVRPKGHFVVPWGGTEGRLGTNPIAYGVPTGNAPIVTDFATSVIPEGEVRQALEAQKPLPDLAAIDATGKPTTDPSKFYGPPKGALMPFGGSVGYKGYALGLLAEILGGALGGFSVRDTQRSSNALWLLVIEPTAFLALDEFKNLADDLIAYVKSSPAVPGGEVLVPGEMEERERLAADGTVFLASDEWASILAAARALGIDTSAYD